LPALEILLLLQEKHIAYYDPHVPAFQHDGLERASLADLEAALDEADGVLFAADHSPYDWPAVHRCARMIVEARVVLHRTQAVMACI